MEFPAGEMIWVVMKSGTQNLMGEQKNCETQPWKMKPESEPYTWILITFVYTKNSTFMIPIPEFCCPTTSLDLSLGEGER